ncbi:uncharacterized protein VTP21DRAFT_7221 [Calcarisporiella thermophila]|uniref:uncharacterized protein n=1 Tax=Calcarisporiella thermophila TaxID=911321 RepID=UPI003742B81F
MTLLRKLQLATRLILFIAFLPLTAPVSFTFIVYSYLSSWILYFVYLHRPSGNIVLPIYPHRTLRVGLTSLEYLWDIVTNPGWGVFADYLYNLINGQGPIVYRVEKDKLYNSPNGKRLDIYFSESTLAGAQTLSPVLIFVQGPMWRTSSKATALLVARLLAQHNYTVVVPDITLFPEGNITDMVKDVQSCIHWVHRNIRYHGGDPSQVYIVGAGAGSHIAALTIIHDALRHSLKLGGQEQASAIAVNKSVPRNENSKPIERGRKRRLLVPPWDQSKPTAHPRVQGMVLFSGVYDLNEHLDYLCNKGLEEIHAMVPAMGGDPDYFSDFSPKLLLEKYLSLLEDNPTLKNLLPPRWLLIHGDHDAMTPFSSTIRMHAILKQANLPYTDVKLYPMHRHMVPQYLMISPTHPVSQRILQDLDAVFRHPSQSEQVQKKDLKS